MNLQETLVLEPMAAVRMRDNAAAPTVARELAGLEICFLAGTLEHGGAERQLFYWLQTLGQSGARVSVLSLDRGEFWEAAIRELGVPVSWVGQEQSRLKRLIRITRQLRKARPDLVQSQHFFANGYIGAAGRILGLTSIGGIRNDGATEVRGSGRIGGQLNLRLSRMLAANSRRGYCYAISQGVRASRLYFLPNVIDTERFTPAAVASRSPVTLLTVGRLVSQKRLDRFVLILSRLRRALNLKVTGLIVGPSGANDDLRARLEEQARQLGLGPDALQFSGAVSDMVRIYQQASIVLLTSDHEGTPNVLLEAMACGLPVVATRVGGVPEIVRDGITGFLRDRDDLDGLVAATAQLVTDSELRARMGQSARSFVEENHSLDRLPTRLGELYRLALPKGRTHAATCKC